MALEWGWRYVPPLIAVAALLAAAVWLVVLERKRLANVAFALILAILGIRLALNVLGTFAFDDGAPDLGLGIGVFVTAVQLLGVFAVLGFLAVFPAPVGPIGGTRLGRWGLAAAALLVVGAYLYEPTIHTTRVLNASRTGFSVAAVGPLVIIFVLPVFGLLAFILAREAARASDVANRRALLLVSLAAALVVGTQSLRVLLLNVYGLAVSEPTANAPIVRWVAIAFAAGEVVFLVAAAVIVARLRREDRTARAWLGAVPIGILVGVAFMVLDRLFNPTTLDVTPLDHVGRGLNLLTAASFPILTTYALVKHRLFDIDLKIKWTLRASTIAGAFVAVFIVVEQVVASFLSQSMGVLIGGVAAGVLLVGIKPLQRFADRVADKAMPNTRAPGELSADERRSMYRELARTAWADGTLTRDERQMLETARAKLNLTGDDALALEREVGG